MLGEAGEELSRLLAGHRVEKGRYLRAAPRGVRRDHPRIHLLTLLGLQVVASRPVGAWISTAEPLEEVRAAWRAAAPVVSWLDAHVGAPEPVPPRPRPGRRADGWGGRARRDGGTATRAAGADEGGQRTGRVRS